MCVLTECQNYAGTKLQDVCQYERRKKKTKKKKKNKKKNPPRIKCSLYILGTRNQNGPQGIIIDHRIA